MFPKRLTGGTDRPGPAGVFILVPVCEAALRFFHPVFQARTPGPAERGSEQMGRRRRRRRQHSLRVARCLGRVFQTARRVPAESLLGVFSRAAGHCGVRQCHRQMLCFLSRLTVGGRPLHVRLQVADGCERKWHGVTSGGSFTSRCAICLAPCVTSGRSFPSRQAICWAPSDGTGRAPLAQPGGEDDVPRCPEPALSVESE